MLLKELVEQIRGVSYKPTDVVSKNEGMPILRASNIQNGKLNFNDLIFLKKDVIKIGQYLKRNDILVCTSSGSKELVGKAGTFIEYPVPISFGAFCKVVRVKGRNDVNVEFIKLFFQSPSYKRQITESSLGANINNIKTENIDELFMKLPDIKTQTKAVNEMQIIISLICTKQNELDSLEEIIKSRFIELFMDCDRDKYPLKKWKEVVIIKHGKDYKKNISDKGGYPVYGSGGFMGLYANNYLVNENSIIIGRKGTIDKPLFIKEKFWNVDTAFGIEVNKQILNPIFFYIRSAMYNLKAYSTSTTLPSMTKDALCEIEIGIPPLDLQNGFADFVETIDKSKFVVQQQIKDLEELLDKKMDEYFGG